MKRQISISIFLVLLVIALVWLYFKPSEETNPPEHGVLTENSTDEEEHALPISQIYVSYQFYIKDEDGRLVVYDVKTKEIYAQTGIETSSLSDEMQQKLAVGIYFQTEAELYNFLESYSS